MLTDLEALPAFCTMDTEFFPIGKVTGAGTDLSPPLCPVENGLVLYFHILPVPAYEYHGVTFTFTLSQKGLSHF
jgi:hypothetical protein